MSDIGMDSDVDIGTLPISEWQFSARHICLRYRNLQMSMSDIANRCRCPPMVFSPRQVFFYSSSEDFKGFCRFSLKQDGYKYIFWWFFTNNIDTTTVGFWSLIFYMNIPLAVKSVNFQKAASIPKFWDRYISKKPTALNCLSVNR
jgi:hypothetical protein